MSNNIEKKCECIEGTTAEGARATIVNGCPIHDNLFGHQPVEGRVKYGTEPNSRIYCEDCGEKRTETKDISGYCQGHLKEHAPAPVSDEWEEEWERLSHTGWKDGGWHSNYDTDFDRVKEYVRQLLKRSVSEERSRIKELAQGMMKSTEGIDTFHDGDMMLHLSSHNKALSDLLLALNQGE